MSCSEKVAFKTTGKKDPSVYDFVLNGRFKRFKGNGVLKTNSITLEYALNFPVLSSLDAIETSSNKMLVQIEKGVAAMNQIGGIFSATDSYIQLVPEHLKEYSEDWLDSRAYLSAESLAPRSQLTAQANPVK